MPNYRDSREKRPWTKDIYADNATPAIQLWLFAGHYRI